MNMDNLNTELRSRAIDLGLCNDWQNNIWNCNLSNDELINIYKKGIDFCIEHEYPSLDIIKTRFERSFLNERNIYVDDEIKAENRSGTIVINGKSRGELYFDEFTSADIYVRHESEIKINAKGISKIFVNVYDCANIKVIQSEMAKVYLYVHGNTCNIDTKGEILIRHSDIS